MKNFCVNLKGHATKIFNYDKKGIIPITYKQNEFYKRQKFCYICKKEFSIDENDKNVFKLYHKVRDHCQRSLHNIEELIT